MIAHLKSKGHEKEFEEFKLLKIKQDEENISTPNNKRVKLDFSKLNFFGSASDSPKLNIMSSPKYKNNSQQQNERFYNKFKKFLSSHIIYAFRLYKMVSMLVKCMLPISLVENKGFREYINYIDPSFTMPSRQRIKETALPKLKAMCTEKIKKCLNRIRWVNTSLDLWTDSTARPFNGVIAQGIDNDWNMHTIPIEFESLEGNIFLLLLNKI